MASYVALFAEMVLAVAMFIAMCVDANAIRKGESQCKGEISDAGGSSAGAHVECSFGPFIGMACADVLLCLYLAATFYLSWRFLRDPTGSAYRPTGSSSDVTSGTREPILNI